MKEITDQEFAQLYKENSPNESGRPMVLDFYAEWCGPCKALTPILEQVSNEITEVDFYKLNSDECVEACSQFGIRNLPTLILVKADGTTERLVGLQPKEKLTESIKTIL